MRITVENWETIETRETMRRITPRQSPRDRSRTAQAKRKTVTRKHQRRILASA